MPADIEQLKNLIDYQFKDRALLRQALTHRSYAAETKLKYDNQRLEFLGDSVLEIIITEYIYKTYPNATEGVMTKLRSALAQQDALATLARNRCLGEFLLIGHGEQEAGGADRDSTLCDLFEAVAGAIYLDGGLEAARKFVLSAIHETYPEPQKLLATLNPKGTLQEYTQRKWNIAPQYRVLSTSGPDHQKTFSCEAVVHDYRAVGIGANRRLAECEAARRIIGMIAEKDESINEIY